MKRILLLLAVALGTCMCMAAQRLPETVVPESYDLTFEPNLEKATFSGEEVIRVSVEKAATTVTLNAAELDFGEASIIAGGVSQRATVTPDAPKEQATLSVAKELPAGTAEIHIKFTGTLNDKLRGFYLSKSERRNYAVTQFESTDARRAFPCFDDPAFKAVFRITLIVDKGDTAISNSKMESDKPGPGANKHTVKFAPSPRMSSYLVAMLVGDFVCREGGADGIPVRVCALPEKKEMTGFALEASESILKFYNKYYSVKYPYGKLDHIVFPDFAEGAMENVGAITYRDALLLVDPRNASYDTKQLVASVIAHEMAHQWFGDLVTMKWWNDIWLNEGFATWMSWKPLEAWKPEWNATQQEIAETQAALVSDSVASVRTIRANAESPADIQALFDGIAYGKAASVLRMVEAYVGPEEFQKGVNAYVEKHAYGNATAEDFWNQITKTTGKPADKIMKGFTEQAGAPLVSVSNTCNNDKSEVTLKQERYVADAAKMAGGFDETWVIPVKLLPSATKQATYYLLTKKVDTVTLPGCSAWVYANATGKGYYRSSYEPATFAKMSLEVETALSPEERVRIPSDAWALVRVGRMKIGDYLDLLEKMQGERSREVVQAMLSHLTQIHDRIADTADREAYEKWVRNFLKPMAKDLGPAPLPGEPVERQALRADVFEVLARAGRDPELVEQARVTAQKYMSSPGSVDAELASKALIVAAQNGNTSLYEEYVQHLKSAKTPEEYYNYLFALGAFPEPQLAKKTFDLVLSDQVKNQDMFALTTVLQNYETQTAAWELFKDDFPAILKKMDPSTAVGLAQMSGVFCDAKLRDDSQKFFAEQKLPGTERILQNGKERVNACIELRTMQTRNLAEYLGKEASK